MINPVLSEIELAYLAQEELIATHGTRSVFQFHFLLAVVRLLLFLLLENVERDLTWCDKQSGMADNGTLGKWMGIGLW